MRNFFLHGYEPENLPQYFLYYSIGGLGDSSKDTAFLNLCGGEKCTYAVAGESLGGKIWIERRTSYVL